MLKLSKNKGYQVKIIDFQFAAQVKSQSHNSLSARVGQIQYLAPEILSKNGYSYPRDLWSCGVILFGMLTG